VALAGHGFDLGITWHDDEAGAQGTAEEVRALGRRAEVRHLDLEQLPEAADVVDELADALAAGQGGRLVAVKSMHESAPRVGATDYVSAKHGLGGLVKNAALELSPYGITVNAVAPGEIATPLTGNEDVDPTTVERPGVPLGRVGHAFEIAATVAFLCSDAASYTTGASYVVDGGMLLMGPHAGSDLPTSDWRDG